MKFIKTCYGEWFNPALVKHFSVELKEIGRDEYQFVCADKISVRGFKIEEPPHDPAEGWDKSYHNLTDEERALQQAWREKYEKMRRKTRAEACAWLAEFVNKLNGGAQ